MGGKTDKTFKLCYIYYIAYKKNRESMKYLDKREIEHHRHYDKMTHERIDSSYSVLMHTIVTSD
jgi:cation transport regulator ChaC